MGATLGRGVVVESFGVVASGAVVPDGTVVPSGQIWAGHPAKYLRDLTQEEKHLISEHHLEMQQLSQIYSEETEKNYREILDHRDEIIKY
jgi:carbonic anhydrase/acetyltransferase-like protein (isoleucine patch superfamily)